MSQTIGEPNPPLPDHVEWLVANGGHGFAQALAAEGIHLDIRSALHALVLADPSPGLHAVQWLHDTYAARGYLWEDLAGGADSKVADTLRLFAQHRAGLPRAERQLGQYANLAGVYKAIQPLLEVASDADQTPSGRELRRLERTRAREESIIIHEGVEFRVVVPTTEFAAQWWGRGTRWCTSADNGGMFDYYNRQAPLIIAVLPQTRFQMWLAPDGVVQFMDETDDSVSAGQVEEHWSSLAPLMEWACTRCPSLMSLMPMWTRTPELCRAAVGLKGSSLEHVPLEHRSAQLCRLAVQSCGHAIFYVPRECLDAEICSVAMAKSPWVLHAVPAHLMTHEMCVQAVRWDMGALHKIAPEWVDDKIYTVAVQSHADGLAFVPMKKRTLELCRVAVQVHPEAVGADMCHVPRPVRPRLVGDLVRAGGRALKYVPAYLVTPELVYTALAHSYQALAYVPRDMVSQQMCMHAVTSHGRSLVYVQSMHGRFMDADICQAAVASYPGALAHVSSKYKTAELCMAALEDPRPAMDDDNACRAGLLPYVPDKWMTQSMCTLAIHANGMSMHWIPEKFRNMDIYRVLVQSNPCALSLVPFPLRDEEICALAVECDPIMARPHIPTHLQPLYAHLMARQSTVLWSADVDLAGLAEHMAAHAGQQAMVQQLDTGMDIESDTGTSAPGA